MSRDRGSFLSSVPADEISFVRKAFGVGTCCTLNSWTLVLAFVKMVRNSDFVLLQEKWKFQRAAKWFLT